MNTTIYRHNGTFTFISVEAGFTTTRTHSKLNAAEFAKMKSYYETQGPVEIKDEAPPAPKTQYAAAEIPMWRHKYVGD